MRNWNGVEPRWIRVADAMPPEAWTVWREEIVPDDAVSCDLGPFCPFFICKDVPIVFAGALVFGEAKE